MNNHQIFTESKADVKFLKDYVKNIFDFDLLEIHLDTLGSWSGYKAGGVLNTSIKQNYDDGKVTILILDADNDFNGRKEEVLNDFNNYNIPIELFLFPNNSQTGNLESLLSKIAVKRKLMDCFLEYENCVTGHPKPLNDARIYSYLDMLLYPNPKSENGYDLRKEEFRDYRNQAHWDLNHEYLNPLREFFNPIIFSY